MAEWEPTPAGQLPLQQPIAPSDRVQSRPWNVTLIAIIATVLAVAAYVDLERRTGDGVTVTVGGPALVLAVAVGMFRRWRSAWWVGLVTVGLCLVFLPIIFKVSGETYGVAVAAGYGLMFVLLCLRSTRAWMLDESTTKSHTADMVVLVVVGSAFVTLLNGVI